MSLNCARIAGVLLILVHYSHTFVLLTANIADVRRFAQKLVPQSYVQDIVNFFSKVGSTATGPDAQRVSELVPKDDATVAQTQMQTQTQTQAETETETTTAYTEWTTEAQTLDTIPKRFQMANRIGILKNTKATEPAVKDYDLGEKQAAAQQSDNEELSAIEFKDPDPKPLQVAPVQPSPVKEPALQHTKLLSQELLLENQQEENHQEEEDKPQKVEFEEETTVTDKEKQAMKNKATESEDEYLKNSNDEEQNKNVQNPYQAQQSRSDEQAEQLQDIQHLTTLSELNEGFPPTRKHDYNIFRRRGNGAGDRRVAGLVSQYQADKEYVQRRARAKVLQKYN